MKKCNVFLCLTAEEDAEWQISQSPTSVIGHSNGDEGLAQPMLEVNYKHMLILTLFRLFVVIMLVFLIDSFYSHGSSKSTIRGLRMLKRWFMRVRPKITSLFTNVCLNRVIIYYVKTIKFLLCTGNFT